MSAEDPYAPPASELREDLAPRRYGHVVAGSLLAYAVGVVLLLAFESNFGIREQILMLGAAMAVGLLLLQFRQLGWKLVALIVPPSALVALFGIAWAMQLVF